jgi:hypothetical protein
MNDRKAPHLKAAALPVALHDLRSIRKQKQSRVQVRPFLPAAFRKTPGNPGNG